MTLTDLDQTHAAMQATPEDDAARLRFHERLADTELFMLLTGEPVGDQIEPELFEIEGNSYALVFDREERLSEFTGRVVPYAGLPGRALVGMLAGQGIGLALNVQVAPSAMLISAEAVDWLVETLGHAPEEAEARLVEIDVPRGLPQDVVTGLDRKLAIAAGLANHAFLAAATYEDGGKGHVLAFVDAKPGAEQALANAAGEALRFSGIEAGVMDVMFVGGGDTMTERLGRVGLRFDLPMPAERLAPVAPGGNPDKPPKLR